MPISYIKSGKWEDCLELCQLFDNLNLDSCNYFNFYSSEFDGDLKNYCVVFSNALYGDASISDIEQTPMKGVISGALEPYQFIPGKGQIISECLLDFLNFPKNHRKV